MPTFASTSLRPILKGRTNALNIHFWKNKKEVYSNWSLQNPDQVLDGAPDAHYNPGTGNHPGDYFMSYIWRGGQHIAPMKDPGLGQRLSYGRLKMLEYKGLTGAKAFSSGFGHAVRTTAYGLYDNYTFDGVPGSATLGSGLGHAVRYTSTISSFGSFGPSVHKGAASTKVFSSGYGHGVPATHDNTYNGFKKVNEWRGVPSAKAL